MTPKAPVAVFVGPSLAPSHVAARVPHARVEPPCCRGDLGRVIAEGADTVLLLDGGFAQRLAVSPAEIVDALRAGVRVLGAASMGAIRAAECAPAGMEGVGAVAALYRWRTIADDDEVAVAMAPDRAFAAVSVALINVRFAALRALRAGLLGRPQAGHLLAAARATPFSERTWPGLLAAAGLPRQGRLRALCEATDVKRRDAELAVDRLAAGAAAGRQPGASRSSRRRPLARPEPRYGGHDPWLGRDPEALRAGVVRWLMASGRYRRYVPARSAGEVTQALWHELTRRHERETEALRWHALVIGAALVASADGPALGPWLEAARADVAAEHGHPNWAQLEASRSGATVPLAWVRQAAHALALARRNLGRPAH